MEKIAGGPQVADCLSLDVPLTEVIERVAERKRVGVGDLMVIMLDRERHQQAVVEIRKLGARIRFISDGDVSAALQAVTESRGVDLLWGIGGTPEGGLSAAPVKRSSASAGSFWGGCGRATTPSARRPSTPVTTSTRC